MDVDATFAMKCSVVLQVRQTHSKRTSKVYDGQPNCVWELSERFIDVLVYKRSHTTNHMLA